MKKLKLSKRSYVGLRVYCNRCKLYSPQCRHYDDQHYRVRIHIKGTKGALKVKRLKATCYTDAVVEASQIKAELEKNNYEPIKPVLTGNNYSLVDAILKYNQYLAGEHEMAHKRKIVSKAHQKECIRFCRYFAKIVKKDRDITRMPVREVGQIHVAAFYRHYEKVFSARSFNKCMTALKSFFGFLIEVEEIDMKNPFQSYVAKHVSKKPNLTLTKSEFLAILAQIDTADPYVIRGKRNERKNMYRPYLKDGFKLFLLTGGRREEVVNLKWNDIYVSEEGILFFKVDNLKVQRIKKQEGILKYFPVGADLLALLNDLGYEKHKGSDRYVLFPERKTGATVIIDTLSKAFTHYKKAAGIKKDVSLKSLRKTYITWAKTVLGDKTGLVTSHGNTGVIDKFYVDPTVLPVIEKAALRLHVFNQEG